VRDNAGGRKVLRSGKEAPKTKQKLCAGKSREETGRDEVGRERECGGTVVVEVEVGSVVVGVCI
jgi:hypothetical protein